MDKPRHILLIGVHIVLSSEAQSLTILQNLWRRNHDVDVLCAALEIVQSIQKAENELSVHPV
jgi:hypothetical protein